MTSIARIASASFAVVLLACATVAHADVPGRVGRISFMEGDVQAYSETDPEWKVAYVNQPITSRNSVFVGDAGRVEISVGSTTLAMDAGSQVDIQQLDDNTFDANVVRGRVSLRVRRLDPNDVYNLAVPGAEFALLRPGRYRVDSLQSTGGITVFDGQASVQGDRGPVLVEAGNGMRIALNQSDPNAPPQLLSAAPVSVALDDWVLAREARFRASQSERYVSQNMTGYEDLDANGRWSNEPDVGPVWYPTTYVRDDWAPYRYGRWAYVQPWGYTWVDDAPWGFAPFHYGRWVQVGNRWGWCPGAYVQRPVYAPALVGFYGGNGFSASFAVGAGPAVGWYPLAPWQRYEPHYARSAAYINQVNNITIVNPPRRFVQADGGREWNREHGGTLVPQQAFASQRSISRVAIAAPRDLVSRAAPVNVGDLPRPAIVPGAVRRGPEGPQGGGRPDFRSPREFASRPGGEAGPRPFEQGARPVAPAAVNGALPPQDQRANGRNGLPPNYQRLPEDRRPVAGAEAPRPGVVTETERFPQSRGGPNAPSFDRDARPPQGPAAAPQTAPARIEGAPAFERPNRENRNMQAPPQGVERQQVEQQRQQADVQRQQAEQQRQQGDAQRQQFEQQRQQRQQAEQQRQQGDVQRQQSEQQRQQRQQAEQQRQQGEVQRQQHQQAEQQQRQQGEQQRQQVEQQQRQQVEVQRQQQAAPQPPRPQPAPQPARAEPAPDKAPRPFTNLER